MDAEFEEHGPNSAAEFEENGLREHRLNKFQGSAQTTKWWVGRARGAAQWHAVMDSIRAEPNAAHITEIVRVIEDALATYFDAARADSAARDRAGGACRRRAPAPCRDPGLWQ